MIIYFNSFNGFLFIAAMSDIEEEYEWVEQHHLQLIIWHR